MFATRGAKILDGTPNYVVIEKIGQVSSVKHFEGILGEVKEYVKEKGIRSVSIVLNEKEVLQTELTGVLEAFGYRMQEIQHLYERNLSSLNMNKQIESIEIKSLEQTKADVFKKVWMEARSGSLNAHNPHSALSIEKEFEGMKSELGPNYIKSCLTAFYGKVPIGVTMPHIEPGTIHEGRLFYFGILPAYRNSGWGEVLHKRSLQMLKNIGATHYIGATGHKNIPMQRIFQVNGCQLFERKYTYRLKD
ncbi:GNAT family N-acetyltransferase [Virgibacillus oceani]|uniref:N-acetyltransferase n=1 Tax=Virgibacillus oceani TaxID=1479511 RepID=A0A917HIG7_9BACI|nr:GNAT family N-acetyltransferase [Virgibacillus oceani]GGG79152.1 N-acetyltransferase [Virgibacillus oceani]